MGGGVMFNPETVPRWPEDGCGSDVVDADDFDEMKSWWEERGREIDKLYEKLGKIGEIVGVE